MKKFFSLLLALILVLSLAACGEQQSGGSDDSDNSGTAATPQDLVMGTGSTGGTYFALGGAMANAINDKLANQKITITAQATGASVENLNLINAGEMDLGIAMNNVAANAFDGVGAFNAPVTNVSSIGVVYNEVYQIVANASTGAKNVEDLKGLKVAIGPAGSGTLGLSQKVFAAAGLDPDKDIQPQSDSFGDASTKMQDGHIDAACNVLAVELFLLFRGLRVLRLYRMYRRRCTACAVVCLRGGVSGLRFRLRVVVLVGGVHAAAAHIGITGISAFVFILRGIIIFPFVLIVHADTSFP